MIRFDKEAPGMGVDAATVMGNGKAEISFSVYLTQGTETQVPKGEGEENRRFVEITMYDPDGKQAARMRLKVPSQCREALTTRTLLVYPQLWQSVENPRVYRVEALLVAGEQIVDQKSFLYPVCEMQCIPGKGFFLNNRPLNLNAVRYKVSREWQNHLEEDLDIFLELGANCICPDRFPKNSMFYEKCIQKGLILWKLMGKEERVPLFAGEEGALLCADRLRRRDLFYKYQACWSKREVLHICDPVRMPGRTASLVVYSNQKKAALYVNGMLHEFKQTPPEFIFEDIPAKGDHTVLSVQAGERITSVTWSL